MGTELMPHQYEGVLGIRNFHGRALLADDMGLGKTIQALYWIKKIKKFRPVVIVCSSSIKWTWQSEANTHFGMRTEIIEGRRPKYHMRLPGEIVIINYDILKSWVKCLLRYKPLVVIFDEIQYLKSPDSQRTKAALKLVRYAESVLGLSGTPILNRPIELWPVLQLIRPDLFPDMMEYAWRYCHPKKTRWGWQMKGATRTKELNRILRTEVMIRRRKKDVLTDLPSKSRRVICYKLTPKQQKEYDYAEEDFIEWLSEKSRRRAKRAKRSPQMTQVGYLLRLVAGFKLNWVARWVEEFHEAHPNEKLVGFSMHTFVLDHLHDHFRQSSVLINGPVRGCKRAERVRQFNGNRRIQNLFGNWKAAGVGLNLQSHCAFAASFDFPWTPGDLLQGEDRIHRIGQKRKVLVYYLVALGTIEERLMRILQYKSKIIEEILDGNRDSAELDIFSDLLDSLKKRD